MFCSLLPQSFSPLCYLSRHGQVLPCSLVTLNSSFVAVCPFVLFPSSLFCPPLTNLLLNEVLSYHPLVVSPLFLSPSLNPRDPSLLAGINSTPFFFHCFFKWHLPIRQWVISHDTPPNLLQPSLQVEMSSHFLTRPIPSTVSVPDSEGVFICEGGSGLWRCVTPSPLYPCHLFVRSLPRTLLIPGGGHVFLPSFPKSGSPLAVLSDCPTLFSLSLSAILCKAVYR